MYHRPIFTQKKYARQNATLLFLLAVIVLLQLVRFNSCSTSNSTATTPIDVEMKFDSLALRYQTIQDSMNNVEAGKKFVAGNKGNMLLTGPFGVSAFANRFVFFDTVIDRGTKYYYVLPHYKMAPNSNYVVKDNKNIILSTVWDTFYNKIWHGHRETRETNVKFVKDFSDKEDWKTATNGMVLIQINKTLYKVIKVIQVIFTGVVLLLSFYFFIMVPFRVLKRISKSAFFHADTVPELRSLSYFLIGMWICNTVGAILLSWIFRLSGDVPKEMRFSWFEVLQNNPLFLIIGLMVLMLAQAFRRGYDLQVELAAMK